MTMFEQHILPPDDYFNRLSESVTFENIAKGRQGAVLVDCIDNTVPIVRTTTKYTNAAQNFQMVHHEIIEQINRVTGIDIKLNNALIELYDPTYRTMGFHSDQATDLNHNSYICVFSCYEHSDGGMRKLKIKNKTTKETSEITLEHNSIVLFSTETNNNHLHKIFLDDSTDNKWIGVTFRLSKTFVKFIDNIPKINGEELHLADNTEAMEFYKHRSTENKSIGYDYPDIHYTISASDLMSVDPEDLPHSS